MRERDRLELKRFQEEEERRIREPIEKKTKELARTAGELIKIQRSNLLDIADPDFFISPDLVNARMSIEEAKAFNKASAQKFVAATPEYFQSQYNFEHLAAYFERNDCDIVSAEMFKVAYEKFKAVGLLEEPPQPEPIPVPFAQPEPEPEPEPELQRLPLSYQRPSGWQKTPDGSQKGYDPNGSERVYSSKEIDDMTADQYKRAFRLSVPALTRVNFGQ